MTEASWGEAGSPSIDWRMSAALENVPRGDEELAEVTNLQEAVRAWLALNPMHRGVATLTLERPVLIDGVSTGEFRGGGIAALADRLPGAATTALDESAPLDDAG